MLILCVNLREKKKKEEICLIHIMYFSIQLEETPTFSYTHGTARPEVRRSFMRYEVSWECMGSGVYVRRMVECQLFMLDKLFFCTYLLYLYLNCLFTKRKSQ